MRMFRDRPEAETDEGLSQPGRRGLLLGLAGGALSLGVASRSQATPAGELTPGDDGTHDFQPFFGAHQAGIVTPQPAAAAVRIAARPAPEARPAEARREAEPKRDDSPHR